MMCQSGDLIIVKSEPKVQEETPVASMAVDETLSAFPLETTLADACCMDTNGFQSLVTSNGAAQPTGKEERVRTLQASISPTEAAQFSSRGDMAQTSKQFVTMSEVVLALCDVCRLESKASQTAICSTRTTQSTGREVRTRTSEQAATMSETLSEVIEGLENFCLLEGWDSLQTRRSPLPLWYPRRPLQDITAVLNIGLVPSEEATNFKKGRKKAETVQLHGRLHDSRGGAFGEQRAPRVPFKPISSVPAAHKRSSLLRRGFR